MPIVRAQSNFRRLFVVAIGLTCAASLAIGATIWWLRVDEIADAYTDTNNLAVVLADQTANSIQSIDLVLTDIAGQEEIRAAQTPNNIDRILGGEDTHQFLMERLRQLNQAELIGLADRNGRLVNTTQKWPSPQFDLSDRCLLYTSRRCDGVAIVRTTQVRGENLIVSIKALTGC